MLVSILYFNVNNQISITWTANNKIHSEQNLYAVFLHFLFSFSAIFIFIFREFVYKSWYY